MIKDVAIGDKIEITLRKDKSRIIVYMSHVMDIVDNDIAICSLPISGRKLVKLPLGPAYNFIFFTVNGMIRYEVNVLEIFSKDKLHLMRVKIESVGEKEQRRGHFRLSKNLPIKFSVINDGDDESIVNIAIDDMFTGITKDISGSGIRFVSNEKLEDNAKLGCVILIENEPFIAIARLLFTVTFKDAIYKYQYRVKFLSVLPEEQDRLVKYIFNEQRIQMSRIGTKI
ncbi:MAG: flagellar brake domain-containing protein [Defluviitaleaceae bacterium]|nr:flagellar brake domain-containing protein [Defluviitaleaceae bacterium]